MRKCFAVVLVLILLGLASCKIGKSKDTKEDSSSQRDSIKRLASPVEVSRAVRIDMKSVIRTTGSLEPYQTINILSKIQGIAEDAYFEQGDEVKKNDLLARLESREYDLALRQAEADLASAKASLNEAELKKAENQFRRIKEMYEKDLSSIQELEQQEALYLQAKSSYESQQARILSLQANYERASLNLSYTEIKSPLKGIISRKHINKGELISPSSLIYEIVDISKLYAKIYVSEKYIHYLDKDRDVQIRVDAVPGSIFSGTIEMISPVAETQSRTFQTSVLIDNSKHLLKGGMFARVIIDVAEFNNSVAVPKDAVIIRQDQEYCFLIDQNTDDKEASLSEDKEKDSEEKTFPASMIKVSTGIEDEGFIQILDGIKEGDTVITSGHYDLNDGDKVRIITYIE